LLLLLLLLMWLDMHGLGELVTKVSGGAEAEPLGRVAETCGIDTGTISTTTILDHRVRESVQVMAVEDKRVVLHQFERLHITHQVVGVLKGQLTAVGGRVHGLALVLVGSRAGRRRGIIVALLSHHHLQQVAVVLEGLLDVLSLLLLLLLMVQLLDVLPLLWLLVLWVRGRGRVLLVLER